MSLTRRSLLALPALGLLAMPGPGRAEADGPDHYRATAATELRAGPGEAFPALLPVPEGADGLANFGCRGGLTLAEWEAASDAERAAAAARRWCRVGADETIGWAPGSLLAEGSDTGGFRGGDRLPRLAGSEWGFRDFAGEPAGGEATITFDVYDVMFGSTGCNRFRGSYKESAGGIAIAPVAMTMMACPEAETTLERRVTGLFETVAETVATHRLLAFFDADGRLLATLARRDAD